MKNLLALAGSRGIYVRPEVMRAIAFLLTVEGVVKDLDPGRNFVADLAWVF